MMIGLVAALVAVVAAGVSVVFSRRTWLSLARTERLLAETDRSLARTFRTESFRVERLASAEEHERLAVKYDRRAWPFKQKEPAA